jgi:hypothetical protein
MPFTKIKAGKGRGKYRSARKSRRRAGTVDNHGGFQLIEPLTNIVVGGERST